MIDILATLQTILENDNILTVMNSLSIIFMTLLLYSINLIYKSETELFRRIVYIKRVVNINISFPLAFFLILVSVFIGYAFLLNLFVIVIFFIGMVYLFILLNRNKKWLSDDDVKTQTNGRFFTYKDELILDYLRKQKPAMQKMRMMKEIFDTNYIWIKKEVVIILENDIEELSKEKTSNAKLLNLYFKNFNAVLSKNQ